MKNKVKKLTPEQQKAIAWQFHCANPKLPITKFCAKHGLDYYQFYFWATGRRHYSCNDLYQSFENAMLKEFGLKVR